MNHVLLPLLLAALTLLAGCAGTPSVANKPRWAFAIHGGAGALPRNMPQAEQQALIASLTRAGEAARAVLDGGGSALQAVEAAVVILEDDPRFNAGHGAVLNAAGVCELDAAIMDGATLACGAVTGVTTVKNPIALARHVMTTSGHVLMAGAGAEAFAARVGVERVDPAYFITEPRRQALERRLRETRDPGGNTVGCVALDSSGNLAAATSTGGLTGKRPGRVGDAPIIGAGTYAANDSVAVSGTGTGEQYMRHVAAHEVASLVRYKGMSLALAVGTVLNRRLDPDDGGMIAVSRLGEVVAQTTTGAMPSVVADSTGRFEVRIWPD